MLKNNRGFTLIEMLVVLLIIAVLMILIIPNLTNRTGNVHDKGCDALVAVVQAQADAFYLDEGKRATTLDELVDEYINVEQKTCENNTELEIDSNGKVNKKPK